MLSRVSHMGLSATLWTVAHQNPLGSSVRRYSPHKNTGVPRPPPGDLPDPGIGSYLFTSLHWQAGSLPLAPSGYYGDSKFYTTLESNSILVVRERMGWG